LSSRDLFPAGTHAAGAPFLPTMITKTCKVPNGKIKKRRCNRPKHNHSKAATDVFKEWFYANTDHPFPDDKVKADFADITGKLCGWMFDAFAFFPWTRDTPFNHTLAARRAD
jgi:hypothetical protein